MLNDLCFEIIEKCPNECLFCSSNSCISKNKIISFDEFKHVIDTFIKNGGIKELSLSGGEPMLHPDIYKMINYAKDRGIRVVMFTSGIKKFNPVSKEMADYYLDRMNYRIKEVMENEPDNEYLIDTIKRVYTRFITPSEYAPISDNEFNLLKEAGLDKIVFDFQGYEYETDTLVMGRTNKMHEMLLDSLIHASRSGIETDVHFVPMKPNYREIKDILELLEIAHIDNISILRFVPQGRGRINKKLLELSKEELLEFREILNNSMNIYHGNIRVGIPMQNDDNHECNAGLSKIVIKFDGTILPCPAFKEITIEEALKYGIILHTIDELISGAYVPKFSNTTRKKRLCDKVYRR